MIEVELNDKQRQTLALDFRAQGLAKDEIARRLGITIVALRKIFRHPTLQAKIFPNVPPPVDCNSSSLSSHR